MADMENLRHSTQDNSSSGDEDKMSILDVAPFDDWHFSLSDRVLTALLNDDPELTVSSLTKDEKSSLGILVVGREHGRPSLAAMTQLIVRYRPDVITHEEHFSSQVSKRSSDVLNNASLWGLDATARRSGGSPADVRVIHPGQLVNGGDMNPLVDLIKQHGMTPLIRAVGETESRLRSKGGIELQLLSAQILEAGGSIKPLIAEEVGKIIAREQVMVDNISTIVANVRRKLNSVKHPRLKVLIMGGAFHQPHIYRQIQSWGLAAELTFVVDKHYTFEDIYKAMPATDRVLYDEVRKLRQNPD